MARWAGTVTPLIGGRSLFLQRFPALHHAKCRHGCVLCYQRLHKLRLSRFAAPFPSKAIETRPEVLAVLKLRPLERLGKIRPNRIRRGSPEQSRSAVQSPERAWHAVSEVRMGVAKHFENTTISAPLRAPVRVRNRDDGGGDGPAVEPSLPFNTLIH